MHITKDSLSLRVAHSISDRLALFHLTLSECVCVSQDLCIFFLLLLLLVSFTYFLLIYYYCFVNKIVKLVLNDNMLLST